MKRRIFITVKSAPDRPQFGYEDFLEYKIDGELQWSGHCSTCPNPFVPTKPNIKWDKYYPWIAPGRYTFHCVKSKKYGKCLVVNHGGNVASRVPNHRHSNRHIMRECLIHLGGHKCKNPDWRGSAGCITLHKNQWFDFIRLFKIGHHGILEVADQAKEEPVIEKIFTKNKRIKGGLVLSVGVLLKQLGFEVPAEVLEAIGSLITIIGWSHAGYKKKKGSK